MPRFDYEKFSARFPAKTKWTLHPTRALLRAVKFKQRFKAIHIAGTNGKGSAAAFLDAVFRKSKIKTGLYTSPHVARFNERVRANAKEISDAELAALWNKAKSFIEKWNAGEKEKEKISEFEAETALAFKFFEEKNCDYGVIECGLGGRLDATNALKPTVSVVTRISLDHTRELGGTVEKIAGEKAAIIKRGALAAVAAESSGAAALTVIKTKARAEGVPLFVVGAGQRADVRITKVKATPRGTSFAVSGVFGKARLRTRLLGAHQAENAALAFATAKILQNQDQRITDAAIKKGIARTAWPGRLEVIQRKPFVVLDGAHNPGAAKALASSLKNLWPKRAKRGWVLVFAAMRDKDYAGVLREIAPLAKTIVATRVAASERSAGAAEVARAARRVCKKVLVVEDASKALSEAKRLARIEGGGVCVCGSLYLLGELKKRAGVARRNAF